MALFVSHHPNYATSRDSIICQFTAYGHLGKYETEDEEELEVLRTSKAYGKDYWETKDLPKDAHATVPIHQGVRTADAVEPILSPKAEPPTPIVPIGRKRSKKNDSEIDQ